MRTLSPTFAVATFLGRKSQVPVLVNPLVSVRQRYENQTPRNGMEARAG